VVWSIFLGLLTIYAFVLYSTVHWDFGSRAYALAAALEQIAPGTNTEALPQAKSLAADLKATARALLSRLEFYRLLGVASLSVTIWAGFRRPRWACLVALPFALCAGIAAVVIM
jgi:hypothetical protein